jgi:TolB-like protein
LFYRPARLRGHIATLRYPPARLRGHIATLRYPPARLRGHIATLRYLPARLRGHIAALRYLPARLQASISPQNKGESPMKINKISLRHETPSRNLRVGGVSLILLLLSAFAHSTAVLAVLEIVPTSEVKELTVSETRLLSDELRRQAVNLLPAKEFNVLTRDGMIALIPADEEEAACLAESCAVDIGRAIGVEYISTGRIAKFAGRLSLTVELYETMGGRLLGSFLTYGTDITGLMETIKAESPAMFEKMKAHYSASSASNENIVKTVPDDLKKSANVETSVKSKSSWIKKPIEFALITVIFVATVVLIALTGN